MVRARNEELTDAESRRVVANEMRFLVNMEWMFREMPANSPGREADRQGSWFISTIRDYIQSVSTVDTVKGHRIETSDLG